MSGAAFPRAALFVLAASLLGAGPPASSLTAREEAHRANNVGVALLEQYRHDEAAEAFRKALRLQPGLDLARVNLAVALLNIPRLEEARAEARKAAAALPDRPQPHYVRGLAARGLDDREEAAAAFRRVLEIDPEDVGARVNLAQMLVHERDYAGAVALLRPALQAEPYNATAAYNLGLALSRAGQAEEGQRMLERFQALKDAPYATLLGQSYPEQGRYAEAMVATGAEAELVDRATPAARFADATGRWLDAAAAAHGASNVLLADLDLDGDLDLVAAGSGGLRLYANEGRRLLDRTERWGIGGPPGGNAMVAGDLDGDARPELLVLAVPGPRLLRNQGSRFTEAAAPAGLTGPRTAHGSALVDADHDGDLDLLLSGPPRLLQNDGAGRFRDVSTAAGLPTSGDYASALATDFDNGRDVDLLVAGPTEPLRLLRNKRDGTFADVSAEVGLANLAARAAAAADVNKDGFTDFFLAVEGNPLLALSDGRGRFTLQPAPFAAGLVHQAMFLDYDNDGLLDLALVHGGGLRLVRGLGASGWADVSAAALPSTLGSRAAALAAGDLDGDGDTDLVVATASKDGLRVLENEGGRNGALRVDLAARVSNRSAVGAKVEVRAGSLRQKLEVQAGIPASAPADVVFGLGPRASADAVRVLWPSGTLQSELVAPAAGAPRPTVLAVKELDRKPSSCPYLYAWNGRAFEFVTDFMGGGEMGYWQAPGRFNVPDPDEYVRLRADQLQARDGRYELRVTNELEEALFVDALALHAVDHPAAVEVYPDEGLRSTPPAFRLFAVAGLRPVPAATDEHGHDVAGRLARRDRVFVDDFALHRIRGYAQEHELVLDLGAQADEALLLLTGWTDYAFSSDNVAAHQAGLSMAPPRLEVEDAGGRWQTVVAEIGIPVGRPQTIVVPMAGRWQSASRWVRIVTNMRIYWDQAQVGRPAAVDLRPVRLAPAAAELRLRGFSAAVSPNGREPFTYDYARVSTASPWKALPGRYTRTGDVRELLLATDDRFVTSAPGDELALAFDARGLPPLPEGWARTWLFFSDGFSKEMDINSATPHTLEPFPFHGMRRYPYAPDEAPAAAGRREWMERYNTRLVRAPVAPLEGALAAGGTP